MLEIWLRKDFDGLRARAVQPVKIGDGTFDSVQVHLVVRMAQVISEAANCVPWDARLVHFRECAELDSSLGYFEEANPHGVIRHALLRQHPIEPASHLQIIPDLRNVTANVLIP